MEAPQRGACVLVGGFAHARTQLLGDRTRAHAHTAHTHARVQTGGSRRLSSLATCLGLETAMARVSPCRVAATTGEAKARTTTNGLRIYLSSQPAYVHIPERLGRGDVDLGEGLGGAAACVCALGLVFNAPIGGGAAPPLAPPPPAPACRCTAALCRPVGSRPWGILCHGMLEPDASGISDASTARNQSNGLLRAQRTSDGCAHGVRMWRQGWCGDSTRTIIS